LTESIGASADSMSSSHGIRIDLRTCRGEHRSQRRECSPSVECYLKAVFIVPYVQCVRQRKNASTTRASQSLLSCLSGTAASKGVMKLDLHVPLHKPCYHKSPYSIKMKPPPPYPVIVPQVLLFLSRLSSVSRSFRRHVH